MDAAVVAACRIAARTYKVPLPTLIGIIRQESAGRFLAPIRHAKDFGGDTFEEPVVRHEGHYFYKRLQGSDRTLAVKLGLAAVKWGIIKNPSKQQARWDKLVQPGMRINVNAEIESCSWSGPQVMGAHWKKLGFKSPQDMLAFLRDGGVVAGVDVMMRYCDKFGLIDEMQRGDIEGFVRGYNGPANVHAYSKSIRRFIAQALAQYGTATDEKKLVAGAPAQNVVRARNGRTMLRMGMMNDARVREAQALLMRHGYVVGVNGPDGDFGPTTKQAVMDFQRDNKLDVDGMIGPKTWALLNSKRLDPSERPGIPGIAETITQTPEGRQGSAVAGGGLATGGLTETKDAVENATNSLFPATGGGGFIDWVYTILTVIGVILTLAGIAWVIHGFFKARRVPKGALDPTPHEPKLESVDEGDRL